MNLSAVILAGGKSSRMGRDKAWVELDGQPLILRALATLRELGVQEVFISGRRDTDYSALGCRVLFDWEEGAGPLAGLERALHVSAAPLTLALAVDLPRISAGLLRKLARHSDAARGVIPELCGQLEPLAAIYSQACLPIARECLLHGRRAARAFAAACRHAGAVRTLPVAPEDFRCFENWNTPLDLANSKPEPDPQPQPPTIRHATDQLPRQNLPTALPCAHRSGPDHPVFERSDVSLQFLNAHTANPSSSAQRGLD